MSVENITPREALKEFYKLKSSYEKKYDEFVKRIVKNSQLTTREKQQKVSTFKKKCISCDKDGGSLFSNENNTLKVICGNTSDPCELNIEIRKGEDLNIETSISDFTEDVEKSKEDIIKLKMDVLFGYKTENDIINKFEKIKDDYETDFTILQEQNIKLGNIVNNSMELVEIKKQNNEIQFIIDEIKQSIEEFNKTLNDKIIKNVVDVYNTRLLPLVKKNMDAKYKVNKMFYNEEDDTYHLIQKKYTLFDLYDRVDPIVVETFKLGKK